MIPARDEPVLFDVARPDERPWPPIDAAVMGGVSRSEMRIENSRAVFAGVVSLDFGGGFASVRSSPGSWDLSACQRNPGFRGFLISARASKARSRACA
jgi:hypothetical protein